MKVIKVLKNGDRIEAEYKPHIAARLLKELPFVKGAETATYLPIDGQVVSKNPPNVNDDTTGTSDEDKMLMLLESKSDSELAKIYELEFEKVPPGNIKRETIIKKLMKRVGE